ncbi:hypothetical protein [Turicimonas muris]|uniref:hypothetical protein n=1 Tax=Turicimonas muris TaxID=1796652 RepID=UPI0025A64FBA|nr:hypothetical protein [Turicimonas muris]
MAQSFLLAGLRASMDHADLTQSDIEKIEKWERIYKATNRKTFTIVEASAFMIDWHPAAYLNDRRKNLIATVAERIKATLINTNWEGGPYCLEGESPTKVGGVDSYSKLAYYRWARENYPQTDKTIDDLEWFKSIKTTISDYDQQEIFDISQTRFKPLNYGSKEWHYWKNKDAYTAEEMAYLILGIEPMKEGRYEEEEAYFQFILPLVNRIESKIEKPIPFDDDIPF